MLEAQQLGFRVGSTWLLRDFSYRFFPGKCYMVCGPNGAGKSTLLKLLSLELLPATGKIMYNQQPVQSKEIKNYARYRAVLSQVTEIGFPLSVEEVILMGRYPHFDVNPSKHDLQVCEEVTTMLSLGHLRHRNFLTLSGGEKQRVQFARVLTQIWERPAVGSRILLLDEPVSSLDLRYQFDFISQVKDFIDDHTIVVAIMHDLNLVLNYADEVLLMNEARLFSAGKPNQVLSADNVTKVFHIPAHIHRFENINLLWKQED